MSGAKLQLDTNSLERADSLRRRIEAACGDRTAPGRAAVDTLLEDMENHERRWAGDGAASDFSAIRRELRLE